MSEPAAQPLDSQEEPVGVHYDTRLPQLSRWRRMQIPVIAWLVYSAIRTIGPTLRLEVLGWQHAQRAYDRGDQLIGAFWHRSIFSATWWWRNRGVVVMNTTNFDGQWTRRVIERLGFGTAQGSSSRGGLKGLVVMAQRLKEGHDVAFTIDGPRGPRYVAKPGPVMLARKTGQPIFLFHIGLERAMTFEKSWDLFQVPHLFSRAIAVVAPTIYVPSDASRALMEQKHAEIQRALERVRDVAESWFTLSESERKRIRDEWNAA
ncbi:MAG: lysophospholipid acyltransferase family protein [Candidatus Acidiferrales bacterium]